MSQLDVTVSSDFTGAILTDVDVVQFLNVSGTNVSAFFLASQLNDGSSFASNVQFRGSAGTNQIVIEDVHNSISPFFTFVNWSADDRVIMNATDGEDVFVAVAGNAVVNGFGGNDYILTSVQFRSINAGSGNDRIAIDFSISPVAGSKLLGGKGEDILEISHGTYDFREAAISAFEIFDFSSFITLSRFATFSGDQIGGTSSFNEIRFGTNADSLTVRGDAVNLSGLAMTGFNAAADSMLISGTKLADVLVGSSVNDSLLGGAGIDILNGAGGDDSLNGGTGADKLAGGLGKDRLQGGGDADIFIFRTAAETAVNNLRDIIIDFVSGIDRINLAAMDANADNGAADDAFTFIGSETFASNGNAPGLLRAFQSGADIIVQGNVDAANGADFSILLKGVTAVSAADFIV